MKFFYTATSSKGEKTSGTVDALNVNEATRLLLRQGLYVKKIHSKKITAVNHLFSIGTVSLVDKILFAKHLATMIKSGITISEALQIIEDQATSQRFKKIVSSINSKVKEGQQLSSALAVYGGVFDPLFKNVVSAGEESGSLEENLEYVARDLEEKYNLRKAIVAAALYPSIVLIAVVFLLLLLGYFVLPKITHLFRTLKFDLPLSTVVLLKISEIFENYGRLIIGLAIFLPLAFYFSTRLRQVRPFWHALLIKIPIIGKIIINYNLAVICRTFAILLKSGITIDRSILIVSETVKNEVYKNRLSSSVKYVQGGGTFSSALMKFKGSKRKPIFPLLAIKMIGVGEQSGQLEQSFSYLAKYYDEEVNDATKNLTVTLEPLLLLFVGLIVGFVAISVITPIYQLTGKLGR
ncbi:type II secretion system F family protein [Candidatus Parcubacteria bacterium]|nr:MAG: type II secretion system F family protein [Candidatus Parcubacteria bacterium]